MDMDKMQIKSSTRAMLMIKDVVKAENPNLGVYPSMYMFMDRVMYDNSPITAAVINYVFGVPTKYMGMQTIMNEDTFVYVSTDRFLINKTINEFEMMMLYMIFLDKDKHQYMETFKIHVQSMILDKYQLEFSNVSRMLWAHKDNFQNRFNVNIKNIEKTDFS